MSMYRSSNLVTLLALCGATFGCTGTTPANQVPFSTEALAGHDHGAHSSNPSAVPAPTDDVSSYVDTSIGTGNSTALNAVPGGQGGSVFPGAVAPFGMVQWSPDTPHGSPSGYAHEDNSLTGFSLTHFSGAGCANNADLPILPTLDPSNRAPAAFQHSTEVTRPGDYRVRLDSGIGIELTATPRTGFGRFRFPASPIAAIVIDAKRSATSDAKHPTHGELHIVGDRTVEGSAVGGNFCGTGNSYTIYFSAQFDRPFATESNADQTGVVTFDTATNAEVLMKIGISFVSLNNARENLAAENPGWDFETTRRATHRAWNDKLGLIHVAGGSAQNFTKFYTAYYHALLHPNVFSDVNGQYSGFDRQTHTVAAGHTQYANYSGWDIYRSWIQLTSLLQPAVASDMLQSLVEDARQCGALPKWSQNNGETGVMVGDPGSLIVSSGYAFGARNFEAKAALDFVLRVGEKPKVACNGITILSSLADYTAHGLIPSDAANHEWGTVSTTLEYANRDFAAARFASSLGDEASAKLLAGRSATWRNQLHPDGLFQGRKLTGAWETPLDGPGDGASRNEVEGNAEQYIWMVPYDAQSLFAQLGGKAAVVPRLDRFFSVLNAGIRDPYFYMGNEPNFATPWMYNWAQAPWRTQDVVRRIMDETFTTGPGGLPGNDDLGATSGWFVWSAMGLYPEVPGVGGLTIATPLFEETGLSLGEGKTLEIRAPGAPARYLQTAHWNGAALNTPWLDFADFKNGGTLQFTVGDRPSSWGGGAQDQPPSFGPGTFSSVEAAYNNVGTGDDGPAEPPGQLAGFDGYGASYSGAALHRAGFTPGTTMAHGGVTFVLPNTRAGEPDNIVAVGQTVAIAAPAKTARLAFLGAANHGPSEGDATVNYADGTSTHFKLGFSDWTLGGGPGAVAYANEIVATTPYRVLKGSAAATENVNAHVFYVSVNVDPLRIVRSVTLPGRVSAGRIHVFAIGATL